MTFVQCTDREGRPVYINLATVTVIRREGEWTRIFFTGGEDDYTDVRETPEVIFVERPWNASPSSRMKPRPPMER
jgi:hypothetical protein